MTTVKNIIHELESTFPLEWQESYDNSGLQLGSLSAPVTGILYALECTEEIVQEAIEKDLNLIVVHHPLIFKSLKRITTDSTIGRIVSLCVQKQINVYAAHTNLDNHIEGVNGKIADKLGLTQRKVLSEKTGNLYKLSIFCPSDCVDRVHHAVCEAGAGSIGNYYNCGFFSEGIGHFTANEKANPTIGEAHVPSASKETKMEYLAESHRLSEILSAMKSSHPYEEVAFDVLRLENNNQALGSGIIGRLPEAMNENAFLEQVKSTFGCSVIRHTALRNLPIQNIAVCGGAGSFLLQDAIRKGADVFISGDFKYHEFFEAEGKIVIADIGHYESEQFTSELLCELLRPKFPEIKMSISKLSTNPIRYV